MGKRIARRVGLLALSAALVDGKAVLNQAVLNQQDAADVSSRSNTSYTYHSTDGEYLCFDFLFPHHLPLTQSDLSSPLAYNCELAQWRTLHHYFSQVSSAHAETSYLDVGCGTGRVIQFVGGLFSKVTCNEPDADRIATAEANFKVRGLTTSTDFATERFLDYANSVDDSGAPVRHDAISVIQVVQHIPEDETLRWLRAMRRMLTPGGVVIITTTHATVERFTVQDGTTISKAEFNMRAAGNTSDFLLPVRFYSTDSLAKLAEDAGFTVIEQAPFQFADLNAPSIESAYSQYIVLGRPGDEPKALSPRTGVRLSEMYVPDLVQAANDLRDMSCGTPPALVPPPVAD